jgi:hypothetical protein
MEMEKRTVATQLSSIYAEQTDIMEALSSDDSDWDDHLDHLADAGMNLVMQLVTVEGQDTRAGKRIQSLDEFDDDTAYKNFRFRTAELHTIVDRVKLPDVLKVNGSKYTKLEAVLNILSRYGTAGTNHSRKQLMGLHDKRLSELHRHTAELLYAQHVKGALASVDPWVDSFEYFATCAAGVGGPMMDCLNMVAFLDGHFREVCRPGNDGPYGPAQQELFSGHKRLHGWTWEATHGVNGLTWRLAGPLGGRRGKLFHSVIRIVYLYLSEFLL